MEALLALAAALTVVRQLALAEAPSHGPRAARAAGQLTIASQRARALALLAAAPDGGRGDPELRVGDHHERRSYIPSTAATWASAK